MTTISLQELQDILEEHLNKECSFLKIRYKTQWEPPWAQEKYKPIETYNVEFREEEIVFAGKDPKDILYAIDRYGIILIEQLVGRIRLVTLEYEYEIFKYTDWKIFNLNQLKRKEISFAEYLRKSSTFNKLKISRSYEYGITEEEIISLEKYVLNEQELIITRKTGDKLIINLGYYAPREIEKDNIVLSLNIVKDVDVKLRFM